MTAYILNKKKKRIKLRIVQIEFIRQVLRYNIQQQSVMLSYIVIVGTTISHAMSKKTNLLINAVVTLYISLVVC